MAWLERRFGAVIEWMPFDLHPEYPPEGIPRTDLIARYGKDLSDDVRSMIAAAGLPYAPPNVVPNSRASFKLAELARDEGRYPEVHRKLFDAYWAHGENIGDMEVLMRIGADVGLEAEMVEAAISTDMYLERIRKATETALELGAGGVPAWVIDHRFLVVGAQPTDVFEQILTKLGFEQVA